VVAPNGVDPATDDSNLFHLPDAPLWQRDIFLLDSLNGLVLLERAASVRDTSVFVDWETNRMTAETLISDVGKFSETIQNTRELITNANFDGQPNRYFRLFQAMINTHRENLEEVVAKCYSGELITYDMIRKHITDSLVTFRRLYNAPLYLDNNAGARWPLDVVRAARRRRLRLSMAQIFDDMMSFGFTPRWAPVVPEEPTEDQDLMLNGLANNPASTEINHPKQFRPNPMDGVFPGPEVVPLSIYDGPGNGANLIDPEQCDIVLRGTVLDYLGPQHWATIMYYARRGFAVIDFPTPIKISVLYEDSAGLLNPIEGFMSLKAQQLPLLTIPVFPPRRNTQMIMYRAIRTGILADAVTLKISYVDLEQNSVPRLQLNFPNAQNVVSDISTALAFENKVRFDYKPLFE